MRLIVSISTAFLLTVTALATLGCGSGTKTQAASIQEIELKEIHEMYMHFIKSSQKPPAQLTDLLKKQAENLYPSGAAALQHNKYVVVWGVSASDAAAVIAFEKDAATQGGMAIQADGKMRQITADEAKSFKKS
jgi:hypothetical protein